MKTLIYMSEEIKKKAPDVNRVTIRQTGKRLRYGGSLNLVKDGEVLAQDQGKSQRLENST